MKLLDEKSEAETVAQLSFSFEASTHVTLEHCSADYEAPISSIHVALDASKTKSVVLSFPKDRAPRGQSQLIQSILQRYRFF